MKAEEMPQVVGRNAGVGGAAKSSNLSLAAPRLQSEPGGLAA